MEQANKQTWNDLENRDTYKLYENNTFNNKPCENNTYNDKAYENNTYTEGRVRDASNGNLSSVRYDFPYEPEKFDLSEADFAPSSNLGESSYNGTLIFSQSKETQAESVVNSVKYPGSEAQYMNGNISANEVVAMNGQNQYGLPSSMPQSEEKSHSLQLNVTLSENVRIPVQADNSPGIEPSKMAIQMNGHSIDNDEVTQEFEVPEKPVYQSQLSSIPSLTIINSSPEYNKYPVQCNTPQTPKDPMVNPLETQLSLSSGSISSDTKSNFSSQLPDSTVVATMQDIPKLQNLKQDLESSCESKDNIKQKPCEGYVHASEKFTQSLPATLHQTVFQNGVNTSSSLPPEFEKETPNVTETSDQTRMKEIETGREQFATRTSDGHYSDEVNHVGLQNDKNAMIPHVPNYGTGMEWDDTEMKVAYDTSDILQKKQINVSVKLPSKKVVGFGDISEDDDDDTDLNSYLGDDTGDLNQHETSSQNNSSFSLKNNTYGFGSSENQGYVRACDMEGVVKGDTEQQRENGTKYCESDMDTSEPGVARVKNTNIQHNTAPQSDLSNKDTTFTCAQMEALVAKREPVYNHMGNSDLEIFKELPTDPSDMMSVANCPPVIPDLTTNLSPVANISLDSGVSSMNDNFEDSSTHTSELGDRLADIGARPKDSHSKVHRPNSLMGLSTVSLNADSPFVMKPLVSPSVDLIGETGHTGENTGRNPVLENMVVDSVINQTVEGRQLMETSTSERDTRNVTEPNSELKESETDSVELRHPERLQPSDGAITGRPRSWSPSDSGQPPVQKQKRPTSLNLPPSPMINSMSDREVDPSPEMDAGVGMETTVGEHQELDTAPPG